jgi:hypothetical protein
MLNYKCPIKNNSLASLKTKSISFSLLLLEKVPKADEVERERG